MTLGDAQIERWARQIILPEVGGRGQLRLLQTHARVAGSGEAAALARLLLVRAGVQVDDGDDAGVVLDLSGNAASIRHLGRRARDAGRPFVAGVAGGDAVAVSTLVGAPCIDCAALPAPEATDPAPAAVDLALAALAAGEAIRVVLAAPATGRVQILDLRTGVLAGRDLVAGRACAVCGALA